MIARLAFACAVLALGTASAADAPVTLRIGTTAMPPSVGNPFRTPGTPHSMTWASLFDGLTRINELGELVPWLAVSWENIDPLTWRFKLRPGVTFSNGAPFTADAVLNVVEFFHSPAAAREMTPRTLSFVSSARKIDDLTVDLITDAPTPSLPRALSILYMVEPGQWRKLGPDGFATAPIGTGPFALDKAEVNAWKLSAFRKSWRAPKVDRLEWNASPDNSSRVQALLAGRLDIALGVGPDDIDVIIAAGGGSVSWKTSSIWSIQFHHNMDTPLKDVRVRQALNYAVDRKALSEGLLGGKAVAASQPGSSVVYGHDPSIPPIPYDPATAKKLLSEAGYPNGFKFVVQGVIGAGASDAAMYQKIAQDLLAIGVTMEIQPFPLSELFRGVIEDRWDGDAFGNSFTAEPTVDVLQVVRNHSCLSPKPLYCDQRIMPVIKAAVAEFDPAKGLEMRHQIMRFYRDQYMALFLYELPRWAGLRQGVTGFKDAHGFINLHQITKQH